MEKILEKFSIGPIKSVQAIKSYNQIFKIIADKGEYFLKETKNHRIFNKELLCTSWCIKKGFLPKDYLVKTKNKEYGVSNHYFLFKDLGDTKLEKNKLTQEEIVMLAKLIKKIHKEMQNLKKILPKRYLNWKITGEEIIHGDLHSKNILFKDNKIYIIDWGTVRKGKRVEDIAGIAKSLSKSELSLFLKNYKGKD